MMIANAPITGVRINGSLIPRSSFKKELDNTLKPHAQEPCPCVNEQRGDCYCFHPDDKRRIVFRELLDQLGIPYEEISTHSYRKGSASACASGSTQGPPIVAICLRAGWKLGGVLNTYLCLENAGDQFVGRVATGLPLLRREFGVLPPRFPAEIYVRAPAVAGTPSTPSTPSSIDSSVVRQQMFGPAEMGNLRTDAPPARKYTDTEAAELRQYIETAMSATYGDYNLFGKSFAKVLRICLASLCYHKTWLSQLPSSHPWHASWLSQNPHVWGRLHELVGTLKYHGDDFHTRATGIPPYTALAQRLLAIEKKLHLLPDVIKENTAVLLDEKGAYAGNVTNSQLQTVVRDAISEALAAADIARPTAANNTPAAPNRTYSGRWHYWPGGAMHRLPHGYILSQTGTTTDASHARTAQQAYLRWCLPDHAAEVRTPYAIHTPYAIRHTPYAIRHTPYARCARCVNVILRTSPAKTNANGLVIGSSSARTWRSC